MIGRRVLGKFFGANGGVWGGRGIGSLLLYHRAAAAMSSAGGRRKRNRSGGAAAPGGRGGDGGEQANHMQEYLDELRRRQHQQKFDPRQPQPQASPLLVRRLTEQAKFYAPRFLALTAIAFMVSLYLNRDDKTEFLLSGGMDLQFDVVLNSVDAGDRDRCLTDLLLYSQSNHLVQVLLVSRFGRDILRTLRRHQLQETSAAAAGGGSLTEEEQARLALCFEQSCAGSEHACAALLGRDLLADVLALAATGRDTPVRKSMAYALVALGRAVPDEELLAQVPAAVRAQCAQALLEFWAQCPQHRRQKLVQAVFRWRGSSSSSSSSSGSVEHRDEPLWSRFLAENQGKERPSAVQQWLDNGLHSLFVHTGLGGLAWGAGVALFRRQPADLVIRSAARTAIVSTVIPFYFVSLVVGTYLERRKYQNTAKELVFFDWLAACSIVPAYPVLLHVEKHYPLWLGGHVLGFGAFFARLMWQQSDLLKKDEVLIKEQMKDGGSP